MTNSKLTYAQALTFVLDNCDLPADIADRLTALKEQTEKRNSAKSGKPTKAQVANAELAEVVAEVLRNASGALTVTEIMARDEALSALSNQKVSAVLRTMGARVVKVTDKRVSRFRLA